MSRRLSAYRFGDGPKVDADALVRLRKQEDEDEDEDQEDDERDEEQDDERDGYSE